jgi:lipopolysaccharide export system permease protein
VFALSALTTLLLLSQVAKQFGNLVGKGLSWGVIGEFFLLTLPFIIAMTLPMAVLVAVLYAFSRLSGENEVTAMRASGVSMISFVRPVLVAGILLALANLLFNDQVLPRANHRLRSLQTDIARKKPTFALRAQVINEVMPGRLFLRAGRLDEASNAMNEVTIFNFDDPTRRKTIYADSGAMGLTPDQRDLVLTLHDGYMQQIPQLNMGELQRLYFKTDLVRVRNVGNKFEETSKDTYKSEREMSVCEMDSMYQKARYEEEVARSEVAIAMVGAVHFASTGEHPRAEAVPTRGNRITLGSLYCRLVKRISPAPDTSESAESVPPAVQPPPVQPAAAVAAAATTPPGTPSGSTFGPPVPQSRRPTGLMRPPTSPHPATAATAATAAAPLRSPSGGGPIVPFGQPAAPPRTGPVRLLPAPPRPVVVSDPQGPAAIGTAGTQAFVQTLARLQIARSRVTDSRTTASRYAVEIQKKFALAAACAVFVLFGAPVGLRFPRGGIGMVLGISIVVFAIYYIGLVAGEATANRLKLTPFWGMWVTNVIFTAAGVYFMYKVQRSGSTARGGDFSEMLETARNWIAARRPGARAAAAPAP